MAKLTDKQENFAIAYTLNGGNASKAYRENYDVKDGTLEGTIWTAACLLLQTAKVSQRIDELRKQRFSTKILTIDERKQILSELSLDGDTKALDLLNKMEGVYIDKVEHSGMTVQRIIKVNPSKCKPKK